MKDVITLSLPELEKILREEVQPSPEVAKALMRKGIEAEILERSMDATLSDIRDHIRDQEDRIEWLERHQEEY